MQDPNQGARRGCSLSFGQIVLLFAIAVGVFMLVVAAYESSHPSLDPQMVGKWQAPAPYPMSGQTLVLFLDADGTARYGTETAFKRNGVIHHLRWGIVSGRLNITADKSAADLPITHNARVGQDEFETDSYTDFHKVPGVWNR